MKRISSKIMFAIVCCSIVISILLGSISSYISSKYIKKEACDKLVVMSQNYANEFSQKIKGVEASINSLNDYVLSTFDLEKFNDHPTYIKEYEKMMDPVIKMMIERRSNVQGAYLIFNPELVEETCEIWYADKEGKREFTKINLYKEEFFPENKDIVYYYNPIKEKKGVWSDIYTDANLNITMISYTEPIFKNDILIGVVGMDIAIEDIKNTIEDMKVYDTGYAFLANDHYDILIHPEYRKEDNFKTIENGEFEFLTKHMDKNSEGTIEYTFKDQNKIMGYAHLSNDWIMGLAPPEEEIFESINKITFTMTVLMFLGIFLAIELSYVLSKRFAKPFTSAVTQLKYMEIGDFTKQLPKELIDRQDELGTFVKSVDSMQKVIKGLIKEVKDLSNREVDFKKNLIDMTMQTQIASTQAASAIENIAINAKKGVKNKELLEKTIAQEKIKNEFFANISHELKTPLNIIYSTMQLLSSYTQNTNESLDTLKMNKHIHTIKQNCFRLLRLINNLIDITKINSDSMKLHLQNENIVEVIENITMSTVEYVECKSKVIVFDTDVEEKIMAIDPDSMERIILNLISNAIKFTNPGDQIEVGIHDKVENILIYVRDTGIGIPKEKLEMIFERFKQVDDSLHRNNEGSGIGLALVKSLVEMHEGKISVKSKDGEGTEFVIELPVRLISEECRSNKNDFTYERAVEKIQIEFSDIYC